MHRAQQVGHISRIIHRHCAAPRRRSGQSRLGWLELEDGEGAAAPAAPAGPHYTTLTAHENSTESVLAALWLECTAAGKRPARFHAQRPCATTRKISLRHAADRRPGGLLHLERLAQHTGRQLPHSRTLYPPAARPAAPPRLLADRFHAVVLYM